MPEMPLAAIGIQPLVLRPRRYSRARLPSVRHRLEHILDEGPVSGLQPPVALDHVPALLGGVVA